MNSSQSSLLDVLTIILFLSNLIFMGIAILVVRSIWLFVLSLSLMFVFVYLRKWYNEIWRREFALGDDLK